MGKSEIRIEKRRVFSFGKILNLAPPPFPITCFYRVRYRQVSLAPTFVRVGAGALGPEGKIGVIANISVGERY